jgi:hypothetical protein
LAGTDHGLVSVRPPIDGSTQACEWWHPLSARCLQGLLFSVLWKLIDDALFAEKKK